MTQSQLDAERGGAISTVSHFHGLFAHL